jgi:AcrR family transcriptional regulator
MRAVRLTREQWLATALEVVARQGGANLRIRDLVAQLGVSTGSFYWHFKGRDDFVASLVDYWEKAFTSRVVVEMEDFEGDASQRLLKLMELLLEKGFARYDVPIRAWAAQEPAVARMLRKADRQRLRFVGSLFAEMGFTGVELETRTSTFVVFHSMEFLNGGSMKSRRRLLRARHAFFTRP